MPRLQQQHSGLWKHESVLSCLCCCCYRLLAFHCRALRYLHAAGQDTGVPTAKATASVLHLLSSILWAEVDGPGEAVFLNHGSSHNSAALPRTHHCQAESHNSVSLKRSVEGYSRSRLLLHLSRLVAPTSWLSSSEGSIPRHHFLLKHAWQRLSGQSRDRIGAKQSAHAVWWVSPVHLPLVESSCSNSNPCSDFLLHE